MKKNKIGICGFLDRVVAGENGQTMRSLTVMKELENHYGQDAVEAISSHIWKKHPFLFLSQILKMAATCENVIIFPDQKGIRVILPIFYFLRKKHRYKLFYNVVGAWLPVFLLKHKIICNMVSHLDGVFAETQTLKSGIEKLGPKNVVLFKNFKQLDCATVKDIDGREKNPFKICFFSRVHPQKGIEKAIWAIQEMNKNGVKYIFDIYGPVAPFYKEKFQEICAGFANDIHYCGVIDGFNTVATLKKYYLQLFPTEYATEGIPGSIIDSYYSGVPVIASNWNSAYDVIDEGETGILYDFGCKEKLLEALEFAYEHPNEIYRMSKKCLDKAKEYDPSEAIKVVIAEIEKPQE